MKQLTINANHKYCVRCGARLSLGDVAYYSPITGDASAFWAECPTDATHDIAQPDVVQYDI